MKKIILLALFTFSICYTTQAQKFAYVDTDKILGKMPEYTEANKKLDDIAKTWQDEIARKYKEVDDMFKDYQSQQVLLTEDMKRRREEEITEKEKSIKELQKQRFGQQGDLFKKREELVKPIQEKVYQAITKMAQTKGLDFVFDKSSGTTVLYSDAKYDYSADVLKNLGL